jgi:hypothetical protein
LLLEAEVLVETLLVVVGQEVLFQHLPLQLFLEHPMSQLLAQGGLAVLRQDQPLVILLVQIQV